MKEKQRKDMLFQNHFNDSITLVLPHFVTSLDQPISINELSIKGEYSKITESLYWNVEVLKRWNSTISSNYNFISHMQLTQLMWVVPLTLLSLKLEEICLCCSTWTQEMILCKYILLLFVSLLHPLPSPPDT